MISETINEWWGQTDHIYLQVDPMVADTGGRSVLVTRYFRGLMPPRELADSSSSSSAESSKGSALDKVAWFVSLVPYLPRSAMFPGLPVCKGSDLIRDSWGMLL